MLLVEFVVALRVIRARKVVVQGPVLLRGPRQAAAGSQTGRVAAAFSAFAAKAARLTAIGAQRWPGPAKKAFELEVAADAGLSGAESASLAAVQNYATA